jgi:FMN reductase
MSAVVVVGNPKPRSRTLHAAELVTERLVGRPPDVTIDLVDLGARLLDQSDQQVGHAVAEVLAADLLVVASPTYKATFSGLLKLFLERFAAGSLWSVTAVPLMLGADWRHSLAPEVFLRPVLAELGASVPLRGLFLLDSEYADSDPLRSWLDVARIQLPPHLLAPAGAA